MKVYDLTTSYKKIKKADVTEDFKLEIVFDFKAHARTSFRTYLHPMPEMTGSKTAKVAISSDMIDTDKLQAMPDDVEFDFKEITNHKFIPVALRLGSFIADLQYDIEQFSEKLEKLVEPVEQYDYQDDPTTSREELAIEAIKAIYDAVCSVRLEWTEPFTILTTRYVTCIDHYIDDFTYAMNFPELAKIRFEFQVPTGETE